MNKFKDLTTAIKLCEKHNWKSYHACPVCTKHITAKAWKMSFLEPNPAIALIKGPKKK